MLLTETDKKHKRCHENLPVCSIKCNISIVSIISKHCLSQAWYVNADVHVIFWIFFVIIIFHCKVKHDILNNTEPYDSFVTKILKRLLMYLKIQ